MKLNMIIMVMEGMTHDTINYQSLSRLMGRPWRRDRNVASAVKNVVNTTKGHCI